jgi:hypothetical protein
LHQKEFTIEEIAGNRENNLRKYHDDEHCSFCRKAREALSRKEKVGEKS